MEQLKIEEGIAMPATTRGNGVNYVNTFKSVIKPVLDQMDKAGQSFFYPTSKPEKDRRNLLWVANKYGAIVGKKFTAIAVLPVAAKEQVLAEDGTEIAPALPAVKGGIRFFLVEANLPITDPALSTRQQEIIGNALAIAEAAKEDSTENGAEENNAPAPEVKVKGK